MGKINNHNDKAWVHNELIAGIISWEEYLAVYNRDEIEGKEEMVLIALHNPGHFVHPDIKIEGFHDVLQMNFWDTLDGNETHPPLTWEQGKELKDFIEMHKDKQFLIHCAAGISRSAGVGCAVECIVNFGGNDYHYKTGSSDIKAHYRYAPNPTVYDRIIKNNLDLLEKFDEEYRR